MNRISIYELAQVLVEKNGLDRHDAEHFVSSIFTIVQSGLEHDSVVKIKGLGTFKIIGVEARESVNVNTGERVVIESHGKVTFTPDATMKELVNKPFSQFETVVLNDGVEFDDMNGGEAISLVETVVEDELREVDGSVDNVGVGTGKVRTGVEAIAAVSADEVAEGAVGGAGVKSEQSQSRFVGGRSLKVENAIGDIKEVIDGMGVMGKSGSKTSGTEETPVPLEIPYSLADLEALPDLSDTTVKNPVDDTPKAIVAESEYVQQESELTVVVAGDIPGMPESQPDTCPADEAAERTEAVAVMEPQEAESGEAAEQEPVKPAVVENKEVVDVAAVEQSAPSVNVAATAEKPVEGSEAVSGVSRRGTWLFLISLFMIFIPAAFFGGYFFNKLLSDSAQENAAEEVESNVNAETSAIPQKDATTVVDTLASRRDTLADSHRADAGKAESVDGAEHKDTSGAKKESADKAENTVRSEDAPVDYKKYEEMDNRVRTGAYRIVGTLDVRTVKQGETLERISKKTLGEGMECYIEVYNGLERGAKLSVGQKIRIPKLVLKKAARRK